MTTAGRNERIFWECLPKPIRAFFALMAHSGEWRSGVTQGVASTTHGRE